jgi:hypothetical protein
LLLLFAKEKVIALDLASVVLVLLRRKHVKTSDSSSCLELLGVSNPKFNPVLFRPTIGLRIASSRDIEYAAMADVIAELPR